MESCKEGEYQKILLSKEGVLATIALNKPAALNALDTPMLHELQDAIRRIAADPEVLVTVVTGCGDRAFCSGIDVNEVRDMDGWRARAIGRELHQTFSALRTLEKPVIAAINGLCLGAGLELAVSCDLLIGSETSRYGFPHMRIGIPSIVEAGILPQAIGIFRTKWLCFTAEYWDARQAYDAGLLNQVVPPDRLNATVRALAEKLAGYSPIAMALQKEIIHKWMTSDLETAIDFSINTVFMSFESQDQKEGMRAFLEKRKPIFKGR
ncbi:MAG: enoyl-CoA hydratase-related protein [Armatimonadota bacterium]|nr:enoyl-CoA hydratase-related protein [Armatimonadota bacterium]MDR7469492.1 enoyl-CoA hydratase-related protein [Armatimonadota bacterium]MDR7475443.1 enoyl-CoA hydratase-related protein [Armatimonadota bacterium]